MKKSVKRKSVKIVLSNRWLYTLITVGILIILGVGVYAYGTSNPSTFGHSAGELNLDGISRVLTAEAVGTSSAQSVYDIGANNIAAQTSIYSYGKICVGNSLGDCSGTGGTVITPSSVTTASLCLGGSCKSSWSSTNVEKAIFYYLNPGAVNKGCSQLCMENEPSGVNVESGQCISAWAWIRDNGYVWHWEDVDCTWVGSDNQHRCLCAGMVD